MFYSMNIFRALLISFFVLLLAACSSGGGGSDAGSLTGAWSGNLEDPAGDMHTFTVVFSGTDITSISIDGADQGLTGTTTLESTNVYSFTLSDTTEGGFIVDSSITHAAFVDEDFNIGAVQKGAGALPSFSQSDLAVSASGVVVTTDFDTFQQETSSVTCDASGSCTGSDGFVGAFTSSATIDTLGRWIQSTSSSAGFASGAIFLTADKTFAAAYGCTGFFPSTCSFSAWTKN